MIRSGTTQAAPLPVNEAARLEALEKFRLWHTPADAELDRLTRLAAHHFQVPTALISLVGKNQQWFKSRVGLDACETSRDVSFCSHAILAPDVLVIPDATLDARFEHNSLVTGPPWIRFYAGAPLAVEDDIRLGSFCVVDYKPRPSGLSQRDMEFLKDLAALAVGMFDQYLNRNLFEASPAAIYVFDMETHAILGCNSAAVNLLGYSAEELEALTLQSILEPGSLIASFSPDQDSAIPPGQSGPMKYVRKDGKRVLALMTSRKISYLGRDAMMCILTDISEITETQRRLHLALNAAEAAVEAKTQFLANMSHELRTPLTHIIGMADLLLISDVTSEQREYAALISSSGQTLTALVNGILEYSREGARAAQVASFSPEGLLADAVLKWSAECERKSVDLKSKIGLDLPAMVTGDVSAAAEVLDRLLSNAVKFTLEGHIDVELTASLEESGRGQLCFEITDTGIGISREMIAHVFKPFRQEDVSNTRPFGGAGLGLAICRKIMDEVNGSLTFDSSKETGSTFRFSLPVELCGQTR